jgi:hypothetical protein
MKTRTIYGQNKSTRFRMLCKSLILWLRGVDLNHRPLGYEPNELPGCSTPQVDINSALNTGSNGGSCG